MFKRKGGGVKGFLNNVQKNCTFLTGGLPLLPLYDQNLNPQYNHERLDIAKLGHICFEKNGMNKRMIKGQIKG